MKIKQLIKHLFRCRHDWSITACNGYGIETERTCIKCRIYQHRFIKFGCDSSEEWRDGKFSENTRQPKYTRLNIKPLNCAKCGADCLYYDGYHCPNGCDK